MLSTWAFRALTRTLRMTDRNSSMPNMTRCCLSWVMVATSTRDLLSHMKKRFRPMLTEHRKIFATIYHRAQAELRQSHSTFFIARCFNDKYRSMKDINPDKDSIKIKKGLTFDKDLFKSLSNDASRAKTHTNHIINNTKTNNQRVVCERTSSSTRLQSYCFLLSWQIFSYIFLINFRMYFLIIWLSIT